MSVLKAKARNKLQASKFGLPKTRQYPEDTPRRAANAKARATQMVAKGKLTPAKAAQIRHRANIVLGETDSTYHNA